MQAGIAPAGITLSGGQRLLHDAPPNRSTWTRRGPLSFDVCRAASCCCSLVDRVRAPRAQRPRPRRHSRQGPPEHGGIRAGNSRCAPPMANDRAFEIWRCRALARPPSGQRPAASGQRPAASPSQRPARLTQAIVDTDRRPYAPTLAGRANAMPPSSTQIRRKRARPLLSRTLLDGCEAWMH